MTSDKEVNRVIKEAVSRGWVFIRKGKHLVYRFKNNKSVFVSITPSTRNAWKMVERDFKKREI